MATTKKKDHEYHEKLVEQILDYLHDNHIKLYEQMKKKFSSNVLTNIVKTIDHSTIKSLNKQIMVLLRYCVLKSLNEICK